jgi:hypothetical protein
MRAYPAIPLVLVAALGGAFSLAQLVFAAPRAETAPATRLTAPPPAGLGLVLPDAAATGSTARPITRHVVADVRRSVALSERPGGPSTLSVRPTTEFGSPQVRSVAARRGNWLGVVTTESPDNALAWVRRESLSLRLRRTRWSLHADLSGRTLTLRLRARRVLRLPVAVGGSRSPTPTGRFAVTDKLSGARFGPYYGCCILVLTGHQTTTPPGWQGGDRLAIHGTNAPATIGTAASAGCLRAADAALQMLMSKVPLGTPVVVHR